MFLEKQQGVDIVNAIKDKFAPLIPMQGRVDNKIISAQLPFLPPAQIEPGEHGPHRERAVVFSAEEFESSRDASGPCRVQREEKKKEKEHQQASLPISSVIVLFEQRGLGRFLVADVQAQLRLRGVLFRQGDKIGVLMEKWRVFDASAALLAAAHVTAAVSGGAVAAAAVAIAAPAAAPTAVTAVATAVAARAKTACSKCGLPGHNKKTCSTPVAPAPATAAVVAAAPPSGVSGGAGLGPDSSPAKRARAFADANAAASRDRAAQAAAQAAAATQ